MRVHAWARFMVYEVSGLDDMGFGCMGGCSEVLLLFSDCTKTPQSESPCDFLWKVACKSNRVKQDSTKQACHCSTRHSVGTQQ